MFKELFNYFPVAVPAFIALWVVSIAGWITHIVWCIQNREFLFMIAAGLVAPVGAIHGICLWFGITWI